MIKFITFLSMAIYIIAAFAETSPTMNGDQVFSGVRNQVLHFSLAGASSTNHPTLSYEIVDQPSVGTLKNCLNGTQSLACEFLPSAEFRGTTSFSYRAFDGNEVSANIARVILKYDSANRAPTVGAGQDFSVGKGQIIDFKLSQGKDADGDELKYTLVSISGNGTIQNCLDGSASVYCRYLAPNSDEAVQITYKSNDGLSDSLEFGKVIIRVGAVNHAPTMNGDQIIYYEPGKQV